MGIHDFFRQLGWMVVLIALQVLFFNHICLLGYATPIAYVYILCLLPINLSRNSWLLWGFVTGFCADFFSETPGLGAASMTVAAMCAPGLVSLFAPKDILEEKRGVLPLFETSGRRYAITLVLLHHAVYIVLEMFSFGHPLHMLYAWGSSCLLTILIILALARLGKSQTLAK